MLTNELGKLRIQLKKHSPDSELLAELDKLSNFLTDHPDVANLLQSRAPGPVGAPERCECCGKKLGT